MGLVENELNGRLGMNTQIETLNHTINIKQESNLIIGVIEMSSSDALTLPVMRAAQSHFIRILKKTDNGFVFAINPGYAEWKNNLIAFHSRLDRELRNVFSQTAVRIGVSSGPATDLAFQSAKQACANANDGELVLNPGAWEQVRTVKSVFNMYNVTIRSSKAKSTGALIHLNARSLQLVS
jgi:hypothetical protein